MFAGLEYCVVIVVFGRNNLNVCTVLRFIRASRGSDELVFKVEGPIYSDLGSPNFVSSPLWLN